jgi:hypothetical protein
LIPTQTGFTIQAHITHQGGGRVLKLEGRNPEAYFISSSTSDPVYPTPLFIVVILA